MTEYPYQTLIARYDLLVDMGIALSSEMNHTRLLERILEGAKTLAHADGGTLYAIDDGFATIRIIHNDSLGIRLGGSGEVPNFPPIPLSHADGSPNLNHVVTCAVHHGTTVNVPDSYSETDEFDFSGTARFDQQTGYRSVSLLTVPLRDHENIIIGVLQLINALDPATGEVVVFDSVTQRLVEALASQAAIALTKESLIQGMNQLFNALTRLIADTIDQKSPYTGGHCRRVPDITMRLAEAAHRADYGPLRAFHMTDADRYELEVAGWLHDCGKIATPEYIMDKATKLETVFDRIELVDTRYEVLLRDAEIAALRRKRVDSDLSDDPEYLALCRELETERAFLRRCNTGGESMSDEDRARVRGIGAREWRQAGAWVPLLTDDEIENLGIARGTLNPRERAIINRHIHITIDMLESLPFPRHLRNVVEYAGGHHERMDGKGYPKGLRREQMSVPARIMGIADIFEALTAADRPYKPGKPLSETLAIMERMRQTGHIDPDLFEIFLKEKIYLAYARDYLDPSQIDVD